MTAIGELVVKIVPDAKNFRRETAEEMRKAGLVAEAEYDKAASGARKSSSRRRLAEAAATGAAAGAIAGRRDGESYISAADAALARGSGRVTKRSTSIWQGVAGGLAFNASIGRGLASTFGLIGGKALYAGAAISVVGGALKTVAIGAVGVGLGAAAFTALSVASLRSAGTLEMQSAAMDRLMGSAEAGSKMMKDLIEFSKTTPFELEGTIDAAKRLMAMGFAAEEVLPTLRRIGDATAALGTGTEGLSRLSLVMGQIRSKGKLMTQDVNQLAEQGIPLWDILADKLGKTRGEVMGLTQEGLIPAEVALEALNEYMDMKFSGTMQVQAETLLGTFENLKETLKLGFAERLMKDLPAISEAIRDIFPDLEGLSVRIADALGPTLVDYLSAATPAIGTFADALSGLVVDLMGTWTPVMSQLTVDLSDAFANARPGLQVLSDAFAALTSKIGSWLPGIASAFTDISLGISDISFALSSLNFADANSGMKGFLDSVGPLRELREAFGMLTNSFSLMPIAFLQASSLVQEYLGKLLDTFATVAKAFGMDDLSESLRGAADEAMGRVDELEGRLARAQLDADVRIELEDAENRLIAFTSKLEAIDPKVLIDADISLEGLRQGDIGEINKLLGLPDQVLLDAGLDPATVQTQALQIKDWIQGLDPRIQSTLNADATQVDAKLSEIEQQAQKDFVLALQGDPSGFLTAAAQANAKVEEVANQVMIFDKTTGRATLAADAGPAELATALAQNLVFNYDGTTGTSTLFTQDEASFVLTALGLKVAGWDQTTGTADLGADNQLAEMELNETQQLLNRYDASKATYDLDADPRTAELALSLMEGKLERYDGSKSTSILDADRGPAENSIFSAERSVTGFSRQKGTAKLDVDTSGVSTGVANALSSVASWAGRTFSAVLSTVTGNAAGGLIGLASGGQVPVAVSNGEFALSPATVNRIGIGNALALNAGKRIQPGLIRGPGTGTSDSIRGTLPPNSFVVKASSVRKLGSGYLRSLAEGGSVSGVTTGVGAGNSYNWTVFAKNEPSEDTMLKLMRRTDALYGGV